MRFPRMTALIPAVSLALAGCSWVTRTQITHPALDPTTAMASEALVVGVRAAGTVSAPRNVVRGAGEGASTALKSLGGGGPVMGGEEVLMMLILAPIIIPPVAAVGAGMARSAEEVDAAEAAFRKLGRDRLLVVGLERRILDALAASKPGAFACRAARSEVEGSPCPEATSITTLSIKPYVRTLASGRYNPVITLEASVYLTATTRDAGGETERRLFDAAWRLEEEAGAYFELAANDAALMRRKLGEMMDRFADRIVRDIFTAPAPETVVRLTRGGQAAGVETPKGVIVRIRQQMAEE